MKQTFNEYRYNVAVSDYFARRLQSGVIVWVQVIVRVFYCQAAIRFTLFPSGMLHTWIHTKKTSPQRRFGFMLRK